MTHHIDDVITVMISSISSKAYLDFNLPFSTDWENPICLEGDLESVRGKVQLCKGAFINMAWLMVNGGLIFFTIGNNIGYPDFYT